LVTVKKANQRQPLKKVTTHRSVMGELTFKVYFTGLSVIFLLQLYAIVSGIYIEEWTPYVPDPYARWLTLMDYGRHSHIQTGFGLWSWLALLYPSPSQQSSTNFLMPNSTIPSLENVLATASTASYLLALWLLCLSSALTTLWLCICFVLGLNARRNALLTLQKRFSGALATSALFAVLLILTPLFFQLYYVNQVLFPNYKIFFYAAASASSSLAAAVSPMQESSWHLHGPCFWAWTLAAFLSVLWLPLSVVVLRRDNKELRYRFKTLLK
jgi:hypothetical protein